MVNDTMPFLLSLRRPFEIFNSVVGFDAVLVIHGGLIRGVGNESRCHKFVDGVMLSLPIICQTYCFVAVSVNFWMQYFAFSVIYSTVASNVRVWESLNCSSVVD